MRQRLDPIIEELHEVRREIAKRFDGDIHRIAEDARQRQADVAAEGFLRDRVVRANRAGLAHAPALDHGAARGRLPVAGRTF